MEYRVDDIGINDTEQKKVFLLMEAFVFHYHELDKFEFNLLVETAKSLNAEEELKWAIDFINQDRPNSFERTRNYLKEKISGISDATRVNYLIKIWQATNSKGYITEMEALALLKIAKDWKVETELIKLIRSK
jgi:hypothetical protein